MNEQVVLVTTVDIMAGAEEKFNRWYNEKHMPEILACPGFISGSRFESTGGQPQYMAIYEIEDEHALETPEMQEVRGWGDMFPYVRNFHERIYRRTFSMSAPS